MNQNKLKTALAGSLRISTLAALLLGLAMPAGAQTYTLTSAWSFVGTTNNLDTLANNRGMAYGMTNQLFIMNKATPKLSVYDNLGNSNGAVNLTGVSGGNFPIDKLGVSGDGVLYGANLNTAITTTQPYKVYRWTDWTQPPSLAYATTNAGDSVGTLFNGTSRRLGDTFAIAGSGVNTLMLAGILSNSVLTTNFVILSTADGTNFTSSVIAVSGLPSGGSGVLFGLSFFTNNTFLVAPDSPNNNKLYLVSYPANFASQSGLVPGSVIATNTFSGNWVDLAYNAPAKLLAAHGNAAAAVSLYSFPSGAFSSMSLVASSNLTFTTSQSINGNETGEIVFGGAGNTNEVFVLDTSAGVQACNIGFTPAPIAPTIATAPAGGSVYTNLGSYTFNVSASGSAPLAYQWQYNSASNLATAANISGATNSTYTITPLPTSASGWYDVIITNAGGALTSAPVQLTVTTGLSNPSVTTLWHLAADNSQPYLDTSYNTRGLAFDPTTMSVLVAEHATVNIYVLNATNGALEYELTTPSTGLPIGSIFPLGQVVVADDGVVYCCNVSSYGSGQQTGNNDFSITRFDSVTNPTNTASYNFEAAFTGDPGNYWPPAVGTSSMDRWGDSMAVRGGGTNTQILLGTYEPIGSAGNYQFGTGPGTNVAILTTPDGTNFTATTIAVTNAPGGFAYLGVAWGTNNTFWTKSPGYDLRQVQYDLVSGTGWVIQDFSTTASAGSLSSVCGIGLDNTNNILAGVNINDSPNDLELFQIPTSGAPPQAYYQAFFPAYNANINGNAATTIKFPYIFSLDANNGIIALTYTKPPLLPFSITGVTLAGGAVVLNWQTVAGHSYQVQSTPALVTGTNSWSNLGSPIVATSTNTFYTNSSPAGAAQFYRISGH